MKKRKLVNKKINRLSIGKCQICGNSNVAILENHRIVPGEQGGTYSKGNTVLCCPNCHSLVHRDNLIIKGWFDSTSGKVLIIEENGEEKIIPSH